MKTTNHSKESFKSRFLRMLDGRRQLAWIFVVLLFIVAAQPRIASGQPEKHPEAPKVKFLIRTVDGEKKMSKDTFKAGEPILIRALIKNESSRIYPIVYHGDYFQFRFDLRKIGSKRVERFRKDKEEVIAEKSHLPGFTSGLTANPIEPGKFREISTLDLGQWYENLEPGKYRLIIAYRQERTSPVLWSNPIIIEIVP